MRVPPKRPVQAPAVLTPTRQVRSVLNSLTADPRKTLDPLKIAERCVALAQLLAEKRFYSYQIELAVPIVYSLLMHDGDALTSLMSRQAGKTETIGGICASISIVLPLLARLYPDDWHLNITDDSGNYRGFRFGVRTGIYAPRVDQSAITFERVRRCFETDTAARIMRENRLSFEVNNGNQTRITNGSRILCETASEQSKIEGETHHLLIIEEAQDVGDMKIKKCFAAGTEFLLPDGRFTSVEKLVARKAPVLSPDGWHSKGVEYYENGVQPTLRFTVSGGASISVTPNHRLLVYSRSWRIPRMLEAKEVRAWKHRLAVPDSTPVFGDLGSLDEGYLLGSLLGDGCLSGKVQFIGTWRQVRRMLPEIKRRKCRVRHYEKVSAGVHTFAFQEMDHCQNGVIDFVRSLGLFNVTGADKFIPNRAWSEEFLIGLIEGLFETDGCVESPASKPCISFANISKRLVFRLKDYLLRFGVHSTVHQCHTEVSDSNLLEGIQLGRVCYFFKLNVKGVEDICRFARTFNLGIKQAKLEQALLTVEKKSSRAHRKELPYNLRFARVVSVESAGNQPTYCVTVPTVDHLVYTTQFCTGQSLHPMTASTMGTIVKIGTAGTKKCDFYSAIRENRRVEALTGKRLHFFYPWTVCAKYNSLYRKYIEKEQIRIGESSDEFRMSYAGEWIFERGMFITQDALFSPKVAQVGGFWSSIQFALPKQLSHYSIVAGIDWGASNDSTVVTFLAVDWVNPLDTLYNVDETGEHHSIFYQKHILGWLEFRGDNYEVQYNELHARFTSMPQLRKITMDSNACGSPLFSRFQAALAPRKIEVEPFNFNAKLKSDGYKNFAGDLVTGRVTFPAGPEVRKLPHYRSFVVQMLDLQKSYRNGVMTVEHPDERGAHDDFPDSAMLACWGANSPAVNRGVLIEDNPFFN